MTKAVKQLRLITDHDARPAQDYENIAVYDTDGNPVDIAGGGGGGGEVDPEFQAQVMTRLDLLESPPAPSYENLSDHAQDLLTTGSELEPGFNDGPADYYQMMLANEDMTTDDGHLDLYTLRWHVNYLEQQAGLDPTPPSATVDQEFHESVTSRLDALESGPPPAPVPSWVADDGVDTKAYSSGSPVFRDLVTAAAELDPSFHASDGNPAYQVQSYYTSHIADSYAFMTKQEFQGHTYDRLDRRKVELFVFNLAALHGKPTPIPYSLLSDDVKDRLDALAGDDADFEGSGEDYYPVALDNAEYTEPNTGLLVPATMRMPTAGGGA